MTSTQADARKFSDQIGFFRNERGSAIDGDRILAIFLLNLAQTRRCKIQRFVPRGFSKSFGRAQERVEQPVGMSALQIPLHSFGAEHPVIERKFLPRLESDDLIVANLELDAALLAAETAMRFDKAFGGISRFTVPATLRRVSQVWAKTLEE